MDATEYQKKAKKTALYPKEQAIYYVTLGLVGEAGEVANKVKKIYRDDNNTITDKKREDLKKEIGDVMWYAAMICEELGLDLSDVMEYNIKKLYSRLERGTSSGEGDDR